LDMKEFENRWKKARRRWKGKHSVNILDKTRSIMFVADDYSLYSNDRGQLIVMCMNRKTERDGKDGQKWNTINSRSEINE